MKNISLLLITTLILFSCNGNIGKILRNEKISSTDEFLVKKKEPLILPPDYTKIPEPGSLNKEGLFNSISAKRSLSCIKLSNTAIMRMGFLLF